MLLPIELRDLVFLLLLQHPFSSFQRLQMIANEAGEVKKNLQLCLVLLQKEPLTVRSSIMTSCPTFSSCNQSSKYVLANILQARCLFGNISYSS